MPWDFVILPWDLTSCLETLSSFQTMSSILQTMSSIIQTMSSILQTMSSILWHEFWDISENCETFLWDMRIYETWDIFSDISESVKHILGTYHIPYVPVSIDVSTPISTLMDFHQNEGFVLFVHCKCDLLWGPFYFVDLVITETYAIVHYDQHRNGKMLLVWTVIIWQFD